METTADSANRLSADAAVSRGLRALIIDDEPHVRVFLRMMLSRLGVETIGEAGGGEAALELYRSRMPDVVLLDVNLPHVPGTEILRRLIAFDEGAAVIVITSDQSTDTIRKVGDLGAIGYVLKHLPPDRMSELLSETLAEVEPRPQAGRN